MANRNAIVGIFLLSGLILFAIGIFLVGNRNETFGRHVQFYAEFTDLDGLTKGSKVSVAGMDAGQIVEVGVPSSPSSRFRIKLQVDDRLRGLVRSDSLVTIATEGVVGGTYLLLRPGSPNALAASPLTTLRSQEPVDMSKLLDKSVGLLNDADVTIKQVGTRLDGALGQVSSTVGNVNDVVIGLKHGDGTAGMLLKDQELALQIRESVSNIRQSTVNVANASSHVDELVADVQARQLPQKVDDALGVVKDAAANIDESSEQLHQTIAEATGPDKDGVPAAENISQSLSNLNVATANMADDTEALKHNLLFRGFFRQRGYYNLADLSPDRYREDHLFVDPGNYRAWLSAAALFKTDKSGLEVLSLEGKEMLNAAVLQNDGSSVDDPIVIEGYSNASDSTEQLLLSRQRAILVRQYLQNRFQLDGTGLGVVFLKNSPPQGFGHADWNGVCVVVVRQAKMKGREQ